MGKKNKAHRAMQREAGVAAQMAALQAQLDDQDGGAGGGGAAEEQQAKRRRLEKFRSQKEAGGVAGAVERALCGGGGGAGGDGGGADEEGVGAAVVRRLGVGAATPPVLRLAPGQAVARLAELLAGTRAAALVLDDAAATRLLAEALVGTAGALRHGAPDAEVSRYSRFLELAAARAEQALGAARNMAGDGSPAAAAARVEVIMALDALYYEAHYESTAAGGTLRRYAEAAGQALLPGPAAFFGAMERRLWSEAPEETRRAMGRFLAEVVGAARLAAWGVDTAAVAACKAAAAQQGGGKAAAPAPSAAPWLPCTPANALLDVQRTKLSETAALFFATGLGAGGEMDTAADAAASALLREGGAKGKGKGGGGGGGGKRGARRKAREAAARRAYPLLERWRDACRDWPARLFAFATPTAAALRAVAESGENSCVADIGAGTGYWAALLREVGAEVDATDVAPPDRAGKYGGATAGVGGTTVPTNDYHGGAPCHAKVLAVGAREAARRAGERRATLLLCYAPPDSDMGAEALAAFVEAGGQTVAHVGEACGLTDTPAFAAALREGFVLARTLALPQWGNTANALTLWRRRGDGDGRAAANKRGAWVLACATCRASGVPLRRCRYTRAVAFCSEECAADSAARGEHRRALAERCVFFLRRTPKYGNAADFEAVSEADWRGASKRQATAEQKSSGS